MDPTANTATNEAKNLSLFEASSIVAGLGVGGGIMAVPFLASLNGLVPVILIMVLAYGLSLLLHLMITEMVMRGGESTQLVETFGKFLFHQKHGSLLIWLFFRLIVLNFYALLAAFLVGSGDLLVNLTGIPLWPYCLNSHGDFISPPNLSSANVSERLNGIGLPLSRVSKGFGSNVST